jgi:Arc/MetJ family transcription regulator
MIDMARSKATITLDRDKAAAARQLLGVGSTSEAVDVALDRLIRTERLRADIAAYRIVPPTQSEVDLALLADTSGLTDDTDWEALYPDEAPPS